MSVTVYDRIHASRDWLRINQTFGDTEIQVTYRGRHSCFQMPFHALPVEIYARAQQELGKLVAEHNAVRDVAKALMS